MRAAVFLGHIGEVNQWQRTTTFATQRWPSTMDPVLSPPSASAHYRNEKEVGEGMQEVFKAGKIKREEVFIATKVWNNNHRPERVKPAFEASLKRLQLDYVDLYLIHTPFAFQPGATQDPRDANGKVIYDDGVTLLDTWGALESLVDEGRCKAIGLSDVNVEKRKEIF